jgi:hypothetical protein
MLMKAIVRLSQLAPSRQAKRRLMEYQTLMDTKLSDLDEALFDFAHFLQIDGGRWCACDSCAELASVRSSALTRRFENWHALDLKVKSGPTNR